MIAAWILYALLVGTLLGAGALVLEKLLRAHRRPTRWIWAGTMVLSVAWPLRQLLGRGTPEQVATGPLPDPSWVVALEPLTVQVGPQSPLRSFDEPLLLAWLLSSTILLALALLLLYRAYRLRNQWVGEEAGGRSVLVSEEWGPAVVGFLKPQIVLPRWCRELSDHDLRLILDHETEHMRAGDLRLLLAAGALPILFPWSLPAWWQLARLRIAVEGDCDLRVLRRHPGRTRKYLELLLEVGGRVPCRQVAATMLSEPGQTLERRIRIMTMPAPRNPWSRGFLLAGTGMALVVLACSAPTPDAEDETDAGYQIELPPEPPSSEEPVQNLSAAPTFTPYTQRPDITNRESIILSLEEEYPAELRTQGIGGTALVWVLVDEYGGVKKVQLDKGSGHEALDQAALRVAEGIEFSPALNDGEEVPVWISLPITFVTGQEGSRPVRAQETRTLPSGVEATATSEDLPTAPRGLPRDYDAESIADEPTFTPYTVRPDITNRAEVARALEESYPSELRDQGIGGTVNVWFLIDETGAVRRAMVDETSGHERLDEAALEVAETIEFTPAMNRDKAVPVWIAMPITFTTR
jgi:TonB family protein